MIVQLLNNLPSSIAPYCEVKTKVILLQNGVYAATTLLNDYPNATVFALQNDWQASGLSLHPKVHLISAKEWVTLCSLHHPVITIQHGK